MYVQTCLYPLLAATPYSPAADVLDTSDYP